MKAYNTKQFEFFRDEILGELGWCDEVDASGIDPLEFARNEIKNLHGQVKRLRGSLELRDAAQHPHAADASPQEPKRGMVWKPGEELPSGV